MDKVIPALIVAAISSVTFIAYKHPNAYRKLFILLGICYIIVYAFAVGWHLGSYLTIEAVLGYIDAGKITEAKDVANSYLIPTWFALAGLGGVFYLVALTFLPKLIEEDKPEAK